MAKRKSRSPQGTRSGAGSSRRTGPAAKVSAKASNEAGSQSKRSPAKRTSKKSTKKSTKSDPNVQRLQRVMAAAGIGSRRDCEAIILAGRVEVDGQTVVELGTKVDITKQSVYVDAVQLKTQPLQYFMLNKPSGIVSTSSDPSGRMRVIDLINTRNRVYNVGRLDKSSEGLILVTNDGDLANQLTHPRYGVEKKYHVQVVGHPNRESLQALTDGVYLAEGRAKATSASYLRRAKETSWIEVILQEGRNREIRRLLAKIGHKVLTLKRVAIGPLRLGELPSGAHRELTGSELRALQSASSVPKKRAAKPAAGARRKPRDLAEVKEQAKKTVEQKGKPRVTKKKSTKTSGRSAAASKSVRTGPGGRGRTVVKPRSKPVSKRTGKNRRK